MADLEQNFMQLQLMHESLARFSESFAGFLYGMNMNAFCVDFPEVRTNGISTGRTAMRVLVLTRHTRLPYTNPSSGLRTSPTAGRRTSTARKGQKTWKRPS